MNFSKKLKKANFAKDGSPNFCKKDKREILAKILSIIDFFRKKG